MNRDAYATAIRSVSGTATLTPGGNGKRVAGLGTVFLTARLEVLALLLTAKAQSAVLT